MRRFSACISLAAASALAGAACGCASSGPKSDPPRVAADQASSAAPRVLERDGAFDIIWRRAATRPTDGQASPRQDALYVTRIGVNRESLAVDLRLEEGTPGDPESRWRGSEMIPRVQLLVNGCPARAPHVEDRLRYGGPDARLVLSRRELPQGELTLKFDAFDREHTILLVHDGTRLDTVTSEEHSRWVERAGNPRTGEEPVTEYWAPDCKDRPAEQGGTPR